MVFESRTPDPLVSVVIPVLDEEGCIDEIAARVRKATDRVGVRCEILFVDDGSSDGTAERIARLHQRDPSVKTIRFTRSFGHQAALVAGLRFAKGDAVITMDGDLQHPPETIPDLIQRWREGADVVHAMKRDTADRVRGWSERAGSLFYPLMRLLSTTPPVPTSGDFRLLDSRAVAALNDLEEHFVFVRGLVPWLGFSESRVEYELADRFAGTRQYSAAQMTRLALDGLFSFSVTPLRLISLLGVVTTAFGICFGIFSLGSYWLGRVEDGGWTSLVVLILIFGGTQLLSIGVVSEYVGRIYEEVKRRPRYIIDSSRGVDLK